MKSVIYLGNGFDIALGLKTRYSQFISSVFFQKLLGKNKLAEYISFMNKEYNWSDVEEMLYEYSRDLGCGNEEKNEKFKKEHYDISMALQEYISDDSTNTGNNKLNKLIISWLNNVEVLRVCSFNYTPTPVLSHLLPDYVNLYRIHGIANVGQLNDKMKIVLGIDRSMTVCKAHEFLYKDNIKLDDSEVRSGFRPPTQKEKIIARNILETELQPLFYDADVMIIYGCSMGRSDYTYFKYLFENSHNRLFIIYHYGHVEKSILRQRINEITRGKFPIKNIVFIDSSIEGGYRSELSEMISRGLAIIKSV